MEKILLIDKPKHISSNTCVQIIKKKLFNLKVGHAGTLDPRATGLLIIGVGDGTKKLSTLINEDKEYIATIQFGKATTTFDYDGEIINSTNKKIKLDSLEGIIRTIKNKYVCQVVPIYSAIKKNGKKLYEYARENKVIELPKRKVKVNDIKLTKFDYKKQQCEIILSVNKGFYVRSFANDLGKMLNNYAFLKELKRTKSGNFLLKDAIKLDAVSWKILFSNIEKNDESLPLVIGFFDGIHKGHKKIFDLIEQKKYNILTFTNIPRKSETIYSNEKRIKQLVKLNPKNIFCIDLSKNNMSSNNFMKNILKIINPSKIIVGSDFVFGNDFKSYKEMKKNFNVIAIKRNFISTSKIKKLIKIGKIERANKLLCKPFNISGVITKGKQLARKLGYPTINISIPKTIIPCDGSYASYTKINNKLYKSITFVGSSKTLGGEKYIETHLFDFNKDVYGEVASIFPLKFIRKNVKFNSKNELINAIKNDIKFAKKYLENRIIK